MKIILLSVVIGIAAGLLGALCGVGGGLLMVPAFTELFKFEQKSAVATSMAIIVLISITATLNNSKIPQLIDWKIVMIAGAGSIVAAWLGTDLMRTLSNQTLTRLFAVILIAFGTKMLFKS